MNNNEMMNYLNQWQKDAKKPKESTHSRAESLMKEYQDMKNWVDKQIKIKERKLKINSILND